MDYSNYDPRVAFDDLVGGPFGGIAALGRRARSVFDTARALVKRAHGRRPLGGTRVIGAAGDTTAHSFFADGVTYHVLGDDAPPVDLPLYGAIYRDVSARLPEPKLARVDDVQSYTDFRAARRAPYLAQLESRLAALESAFAEHVADHHGGGRVDEIEAALRKHIEECVHGGEPIDLPIPEAATGEVEAWQDGPEICVTVRVPCADGQVRMITSGTPIAKQAEDVVGCAIDEEIEPDELLSVGPAVIQLIGAARLVEQVRVAADDVIDCCGGAPGTVALVPAADPALVAAMELLQRCQHGDWNACGEARRMQREHGSLLSVAAERLLAAQRMARGGIA